MTDMTTRQLYPDLTTIPVIPDDATMLEAALLYAKHGLYVFPLDPRDGEPLPGSGGVNDSTADPEEVREWWGDGQPYGIGLHCGRSGILAVDIDDPDAADQVDALRGIERHGAPFQQSRANADPDSPDYRRGHYLFAMPPGERQLTNSLGGLPSEPKWGDVRGQNGYVRLEPTPHPKGGRYRWAQTGPVVPLPTKVRMALGQGGGGPSDRGHGGTDGGPILAGGRDDALTSLAGSMRRRGMTASEMYAALMAVNRERCKPPIGQHPDDKETGEQACRRIANSVAKYPPGEFPKTETEAAAESEQFKARFKAEERARREVRQELDQEALAEVTEPRVRQTAAEYARLPQPPAVMDKVLPTGPALLGGPDSAGKSLLARDWALAVASGTPWNGHEVLTPRPVLYVMDEGQHDFGDRWSAMPTWELAKDNIFVIPEPVNLLSRDDVQALIDEYADVVPGFAIFDTIYGMGMPDDTGVKEVAPVIAALKHLSQSWKACTLAIGHVGHNGARRFRGSSMWRQRTDVEWHMAELRLSCERSKIADKRRLGCGYELDYPHVRLLDSGQVVGRVARQVAAIKEDIRLRPDDSDSARAKRLAPLLDVSEKTVRRRIKDFRENADS